MFLALKLEIKIWVF